LVRRALLPTIKAKDPAVKLLFLILTACLVGVTAVLAVLMFRRDQPILGLAGIVAAIGAAFAALPYSVPEE
jgi:membrane associated rhomboid family serine protease